MMKKIILAAFVAMAIIGLAYFFGRIQPDHIRIGYLPLAMHTPVFVAQEEKCFANRNLEVELIEYPSSDLLLNALFADKIDVGYELGTDVVFNAMLKNSTLLKIYQVSLSYKETTSDCILIPVDSNLQSLSELKGKNLGVFPGPTARKFAELILKKATEIDDITNSVLLTAYPPPLQINALALGQIDALFTYEPLVSSALVTKKAKILQAAPVEEHIIDPWPGGVGVITEYFVMRNPEAARKVTEALYEAFDIVTKKPSIGKEILAKKFKLQKEVAEKINLTTHWISYSPSGANDNRRINLTHMAELAKILEENGVIAGHVETGGIYFKPE